MEKFISFVRGIKKYHIEGEDNIFNKKSILWDFIFDSRLDLEDLSDNDLVAAFENFLNPTSQQTTGVSDWVREMSKDLIKYYEEEIPGELVRLLPEPDTGNPAKMSVHEGSISSAYAWNLMLYQMFTRIYDEKIGPQQRWGDAVEIGAGYGCLALNLIRTDKVRSYTIIDLHENLINSFYYLTKNIPTDWSIEIVSNTELFELTEKTIYLLSPGYINSLKSISYDIAFNSDSLGEMPKVTASSYVAWIRQHLKLSHGIFLSKNGHLRSSVGVDKLSSYGYEGFELIDLRASSCSSSALDDFSHFIALRRGDKRWSENQLKYIDVIGDLIRSGVSIDLNELINRFVTDDLNSGDIALLEGVMINFKTNNLHLTGNMAVDLYFGFMYSMVGLRSKNDSVDCAIGYLQIGLSPHARIYAYLYLFRLGVIGEKLINLESGMVQYFCNILFEEISGIRGRLKYLVRTEQLHRKIQPRSARRHAFIIDVKNLYMNLKEGRGISINRGY